MHFIDSNSLLVYKNIGFYRLKKNNQNDCNLIFFYNLNQPKMQFFSLQDIFLVEQFSKTGEHRDIKKSNYFEIIFIKKGSGKHFINEFIVSYEKGDVFIISPEDKHYFKIDKETSFSYFIFTSSLFSSKMNLPDRSYWIHRIEQIINNPNVMPGDIINDSYDKKLIWHIHDIIKNEYKKNKAFYQHNISNMVSTALNIITRNITKEFKPKERTTKKLQKSNIIDNVITYIGQHIYDTDKMKITSLANHFKMTNSALSLYFKKKTGDSLHHYILMYKLKLVKYRLINTDFTVSEIANQLGFTDESHLTRIFKKYNNMTPKMFKKQEIDTEEFNTEEVNLVHH